MSGGGGHRLCDCDGVCVVGEEGGGLPVKTIRSTERVPQGLYPCPAYGIPVGWMPEWRSGDANALHSYSLGFGDHFGVEASHPPSPLVIPFANPWRRPQGVALVFVLNSLVGLINQLGAPQFWGA